MIQIFRNPAFDFMGKRLYGYLFSALFYLTPICMLGVVLMRAGGCVMNDIADRDFDPHVARTRSRPLAAGEISRRIASRCWKRLHTSQLPSA